MDYKNIDEIYAANDDFRSYLSGMIAGLKAEELRSLPDGEKWSVEQIIEHVSVVDEGIAKICRKLLAQARENDMKASGEVIISDGFRDWAENIDGVKLEAPERVQPSGTQSVEDSQAKMAESRAMYQTFMPLFREFDGINLKFPHPYFGPLSAQEWLALAGRHMDRHARQIEKIVAKIRQ